MKRKLFLIIFINIFITTVFSQENFINYIIAKDTYAYYSKNRNIKTEEMRKGFLIPVEKSSEILYWSDFPEIDTVLINYEKTEDYYIPVFFAYPQDTNDLLPQKLITHNENTRIKNAIPDYYLKILYDGNLERLVDYEKRFSIKEVDYEIGIFSGPGICNNISNCGIYFYSWNRFAFKNITKKNDNLYECEGVGKGDYDERHVDLDCFRWTSILRNTPENALDKIALKIDGDYVTISNCSNGNNIITLVYVDDSLLNEIESLFRNKKIDLSKVIWPRHADDSCDYDGSKKTVAVQSTNVAPNKTMTVKENLKLRSGEATSTQVLTVMSADTKVKILELGRAEKIDGINSNWVKVEVQKNAKDRDGKPIKAGTVGWCYGGYLE